MTVTERRLDWGIFFILLGAVPLATAAGLLSRPFAQQIAGLWPVILIAIGVGVILRLSPAHVVGGVVVAGTLGLVLGSVMAGGVNGAVSIACTNPSSASTPVTASGNFGQSGQVSAELSCVDLIVDSQAGTGWNISAGGDSHRQPVITQSSDTLQLLSEAQSTTGAGPRLPWHITLPQTAATSLRLTTNVARGSVALPQTQLTDLGFTLNASEIDFRLRDASTLARIDQTLNASSATLELPASGSALSAGITLNASHLKLCVGPAANLQVRLNETLSSNNFAQAGLTKSGDDWSSPTPAAGPLITLRVTSNVSSVILDRSGECK